MAKNPQQQIDQANQRIDQLIKRVTSIETSSSLNPDRTGTLPVRLGRWVKHNLLASATIAFLTLVVAILAIFVSPMFGWWLEHRNDSTDNEIQKVLNVPGGVNSKLASIDKSAAQIDTRLQTLQPFIEDLVRRDMAAKAELPQAEFNRSFPVLSHILATAQTQEISVSPQVINQLASKMLRSDTRAAEYWPAAAKLITYRSEMFAEFRSIDLPLCTDEPLRSMITQMKKEGNTVTVTHMPIVFSSCKMILDSPEASSMLSMGLVASDVVFENCLIFYGGGAINLKPNPPGFVIDSHSIAVGFPKRFLGKLLFKQCHFRFTLPGPPQPLGEKLSRELLASNSATLQVEVPLDGGA